VLRIPAVALIGVLFHAMTAIGIFFTVDWRHVRWIFIKIGSAYSEPLPCPSIHLYNFSFWIASLGISLAVHTNEIGGKPVAATTAQASTMVWSVCPSL
jgi:hypothetical protein